MQLSHGGRKRDVPDIAHPKGESSTDKKDPLHGFECDRMTLADIREVVAAFAEGARRARDAGLDGVELHGANGYLITQFLSSGINDRTDEYGGPLENRARFVLDIVRAIRARVGRDFHLQMKISAVDHNNALLFLRLEHPGNTLAESVQVCKWLVEAGVDAIHVSTAAPSRIRGTLRGRISTSKCWPIPTSSWPQAAPTRSATCCSFTTV